jgi:hypothetical protein
MKSRTSRSTEPLLLSAVTGTEDLGSNTHNTIPVPATDRYDWRPVCPICGTVPLSQSDSQPTRAPVPDQSRST